MTTVARIFLTDEPFWADFGRQNFGLLVNDIRAGVSVRPMAIIEFSVRGMGLCPATFFAIICPFVNILWPLFGHRRIQFEGDGFICADFFKNERNGEVYCSGSPTQIHHLPRRHNDLSNI